MDKYQKYLFGLFSCIYKFGVEGDENSNYSKEILIDHEADKITIIQNEDINKTKYVLYINGQRNKETVILSKVYIYKNNEWKEVKDVENLYKIQVDFNDRIEKIKFSFVNNLADDYIIDVKYQEADKDKYYAKKEQEYMDNLLKTADIKVSTGADLVNIYFQPCCDKYEYTEIQLYIPKDFATVGGPYGPVQKPSSWSMIKKCKVDPEEFYKSINGLANGKYSFILKQYDKDNAIILETGYIEFTISTPKAHGIRSHINRI